MISKKLKTYLDSYQIPYVMITHSQAFTAPQIAASAHIKGKELAKTVMVKVNNRMAMAVLPASERVDFELLKACLHISDVQLATEQEFKNLFPDCEVGAMPPFGNLYGMEVYVAQSLTENEEIAFNAGTHIELIRMEYSDYERLVQPKVMDYATTLVN
ncbi:YbaK/EbsC family protein [Rapidithrix thailandica]|uniref:YbaK/EbsC family protein n=1 Tax=Rapidithrix thailandica TaxID=413964 RepID=A0AAW9SBI3_9BACT